MARNTRKNLNASRSVEAEMAKRVRHMSNISLVASLMTMIFAVVVAVIVG